MHVEIKVAQNFVLNFLYNKLPRRRVNLFGEELEAALVDKFETHWYPDKPFKGSAFRCLRVTDPNDPVLNRAARESGNPVSDIIENLPADLAIWIDPGEVSYRIGEKGSVKILFSECSGIGGGNGSNDSSGGSWSSSCSSNGLCNSSSTSSGASDDLEVAGYLPLEENLAAAMSSLAVQSMPPIPPPQQQPPQPLLQQQQQPPQQPSGGLFTPLRPPLQQQHPVVYTAGTFAQTKFGSTKLKTNGKKTNRMSPTEFSNYIKQRALQKQNNSNFPTGGGGIRTSGGCSNGFRQQQQQQNSNSFGCFSGSGSSNNGGGNLNFGSSSILPPQQQQRNNINNADPFFFSPLFPDNSSSSRGGNNHSSSSSTSSNSSFQGLNLGKPWSYADTDTEAFLQDILTVGLQQQQQQQQSSKQQRYDIGGSSSSSTSSDFGTSSLASGLFADRFYGHHQLQLDGHQGGSKGVIGDGGSKAAAGGRVLVAN